MADLDSLSIVLRASAGDATKAIDSIINALTRLNGALNNFRADSPYMKGLNNLASGLKAVRISLNGLDSKNIAEVSKALEKMASSSSKLAKLTGLAINVDSKSVSRMTQLVAASDKAYEEAKKLGEEFNFDKASDGVARLAEGIEKLQASIGDDDAVLEAMKNIDALIEKYGRWKNELQDFYKDQRAIINSNRAKMGYGSEEAFGGDAETARRNRAKVGIQNTAKVGTSISSIVDENAILGIEKETSEIEQLTAYTERAIEAVEGARQEFVSFHEAGVTVTGGLEALQSATNQIAESMGIAADKIREAHQTMGEDDFMNQDTTGFDFFDDPIESIQRLRDSAQEAAPAVEALNNAEKHLSENAEPMANVGNIFEGITTALESLQDITLPSSLSNLNYLKDAVGRFSNQSASQAAGNIQNFGAALKNFTFEMPRNWSDLVALGQVFDRFGKKSQSKANYNLLAIRNALDRFKGLSIDPNLTTSIAQLGEGLYKFGLAKMDKAVQNIPQLAGGMTQLITSLANAPQVSESTIQLVTALGNMNISGSKLTKMTNGLGSGLKRYRGHALSARKASLSLASAFGKMYANFFIFFRLINRFKKDIDLASQLTEVQNVVDVAFGNMSDKMNEFAKTAVDTLGMSELTAKQIGSKYQAMGRAMGITPAMAKSTNDFVQKATDGYANIADGMADISINLTKLAGDMASFYNVGYEEVAEKLQAVFTGQTRPLRAFGVDLTQATLKEFALANGLNADIKSMTQAEKTLLRYQYVMAQTTAAQGDFARTQDTWANQTRIATERLNQLRIVLGKIAIYTFKPLVKSFNDAMKEIIKGAEGLLNALGKIFGWKIEWSDAGVLQDESDDAEDLADSMGDAADNAKKFKNFLLGIDELNLLPDKNDDDKNKGGAGAGLVGGLDDMAKYQITPVEKAFESLYDTLYKLGKRIAEVEKELLKGIDWDKIYKNARKFGKGFASFLNGYLSDVELFYYKGRTLANGINTIAHAIDAFFKEFDGRQFGIDRAMELNGFTSNLDWDVIKSAAYEMAHDVAEYINGYIENVNWRDVGKTLIEGVNTAVLFASTIVNEVDWGLLGSSLGEAVNGIFANWDEEEMARMFKGAIQGALDLANNFLTKTDFELLGHKIGNFLAELDLSQFAAPLADLILNLFKAAFELLGTMALEAPLETALLTAFAGAKFLKVGGLLGTSITTALKSSLATEVGTVATDTTVQNAAAGAGASLGTTIAASVVAAFGGYEIGKKLGKEYFETDDMWYDSRKTNVGKELIKDFKEIPAALSELTSYITTYYFDSYKAYESFGRSIRDQAEEIVGDLDSTWGEIKDKLRIGELEISEAEFSKLTAMLKQSGGAMSEIVPLINSLKDAQDEYTDDLAKYIEGESAAGKSREEAYKQYKQMTLAVDAWIATHPRDRMAIEKNATTYEEMYNKIQNVTSQTLKKVMENAKGMSKTLTDHDRELDGSEKKWAEFEKSASKGGASLQIPMKAMVDLKDKSNLAISGVVDLTEKLKGIGDAETSVKNISTDFTTMNTDLSNLNTALMPVKTNFNEFTTQMQANMVNVSNAFGLTFNNIMKSGNQTISWFKSSFVPYFSASYWSSITASIPNAFGNAFKQAINIMVNLWKQFATWANNNMKINANVSKNGNGAKAEVKIPQYSTGGFPEDGFFYANHSEMVGKFSNGKSAVANNEQIVEGIKQGVYEAMSAAMQGNNGGNVTVELHGDASDIFTAVVKENNRAIYRTGTSPIRN